MKTKTPAQYAQDKMAEMMREPITLGKADSVLFVITGNTARYSAFFGSHHGSGDTIGAALNSIKDSRSQEVAELKAKAAVLGMVVMGAAE